MDMDFLAAPYVRAEHYVRHLRAGQSRELCIVCLLDEHDATVASASACPGWERYQMRCGHVMHTRCYRKWCGAKMRAVCPYCGDMENNESLYCAACDAFGHCEEDTACPCDVEERLLIGSCGESGGEDNNDDDFVDSDSDSDSDSD